MWRLNRNKKNIFIFALIILFCMPAVLSLFHRGFFESDDGEWMIIRFSAFHQALADGQFPVRFLGRLNHGYGYPVANFLYPGFMYLGEPIRLLGFGFVDTIKIILGLSMVGSAIFCYLWLSRFFDRLSSLIGCLFYLYAPYHLFDLYKRGSVGEILVLAVAPFILWQIERKSLFWSSIGIAALILSHNTLAVLFLGLIVLYAGLDVYVSKDRTGLLQKYLFTVMFGLGISSFFWIPAIFDLQYTIFSQTPISEWQQYFVNMNLIGISTFFIFLLTIIFFFTGKIKLYKHRLTVLLLIIGVVSIFFASSISAPLWNILPVSFIQFPFRFLSLTILCVAFLAAFIIDTLNPRHSGDPPAGGDSRISHSGNGFWTSQNDNIKRLLLVTILIILLTMSSNQYLKPSEFFDKGDSYYATNQATTTVQNEYMPKWVKQKPVERYVEKVEIIEGVGTVNNMSYNSKKITFDVLAEENLKVRVNTIYYPGWKAFVYPSPCHPDPSADGEGSQILRFAQNDNKCKRDLVIDYQNEKGVMELLLPRGENKAKLTFSETPLRLFADLLSLLSFIALIFFVIAFSPKRPKIKARNIEVAKLFHL